MTVPSTASRLSRVEDGLWAYWPAWLWPRAPTLGLMFTDGGWLRTARGMALLAPAVAFLLGLVRGGWRPEDEITYGYSTFWLCVILVVALVSCAMAVWLWLGYVLGDLLVFDHPPVALFGSPSPSDWFVEFLVPHLVSYFLLAAVVVGAPLVALLARGSVGGMLSGAALPVRAGLGAAAAGVFVGLHAGLWTQSYPLLIRPLWTWGDSQPPAEAIQPVQTHPIVIGVVAGLAAAGWAVASFVAQDRIIGQRLQPVARTRPRRRLGTLGSLGTALVRAAVTTLLLAGLIPSVWQGLASFMVLFVAFTAQLLLLPRTPAARWWTAKLPLGLRLAIAAAVAWLVAWQIGRTAYQTTFGITVITAKDFAPLLYGCVAAIACMAALLPVVRPDAPDPARVPDGGTA